MDYVRHLGLAAWHCRESSSLQRHSHLPQARRISRDTVRPSPPSRAAYTERSRISSGDRASARSAPSLVSPRSLSLSPLDSTYSTIFCLLRRGSVVIEPAQVAATNVHRISIPPCPCFSQALPMAQPVCILASWPRCHLAACHDHSAPELAHAHRVRRACECTRKHYLLDLRLMAPDLTVYHPPLLSPALDVAVLLPGVVLRHHKHAARTVLRHQHRLIVLPTVSAVPIAALFVAVLVPGGPVLGLLWVEW